jgi:hypothetical protein
MSASHFDDGKPRVDLIPTTAIFALADVLTYGAKKYDVHNWEKGMAWHKLYGSALRHLLSWWSGEDRDSESGLPHLAHAAFNILALHDYQLKAKGVDDREKQTDESSAG